MLHREEGGGLLHDKEAAGERRAKRHADPHRRARREEVSLLPALDAEVEVIRKQLVREHLEEVRRVVREERPDMDDRALGPEAEAGRDREDHPQRLREQRLEGEEACHLAR